MGSIDVSGLAACSKILKEIEPSLAVSMNVSISFVIPMFNEARFIEACLGSIVSRARKFNVDAEVIVVDNGSTDRSAQIAKNYTENVFSISRHKVSYARNYGVEKARNEIIAFVDGDVELTDDWFCTLVEQAEKIMANDLFVSGWPYSVRQDGSIIEKSWFSNLNDRYLAGGNIITRKTSHQSIHGFNEMLETGEDYDYCKRLIDKGALYEPSKGYDAIHLGFPRDLKHFFWREVWHGEGDYHSFRAFISSPVALLSVLYAVVILMLAVLLLVDLRMFFGVLGVLLLLNAAIVVKRFGKLNPVHFLVNCFLNFAYFMARFVSLSRRWK